MLKFTITESDHCRPVGSWLRIHMQSATSGYLNQLLKKGHLTVNGSSATDLQPLQLGDLLEIKESGRTRSLMKVRPPVFEILFEDNRIVCFNKPPGLPMHPAAEVGPENLVELGASFLHDRDRTAHPHAAPSTFNLRPVNRLDRGTSGGVILAKSSTAAGIFGKLVMDDGLGKLYLALVAGKLSGSGEITVPVEGKESLTRYLSLYPGRNSSLVALWPETGRMHQLRQHLSYLGFPIIGDKRYGGPLLPTLPGFALHAFQTRFTHPDTLQETVIHAPLPAGFLEQLRKLAGTTLTEILQSFTDLSPPHSATLTG